MSCFWIRILKIEDLYWRIAALPIELPPLRERREDIPDIIRTLLSGLSKKNRVHVRYADLPQDFIDYLVKKPPEGNMRGIEQKLTQLITLCPKDKKGTRLLHYWKKVRELSPQPVSRRTIDTTVDMRAWLTAPIDTTLVQMIRFSFKSSISIPDAMAVIGTLLLLCEPLSRILGDLPSVTRHPCGFQMEFNL